MSRALLCLVIGGGMSVSGCRRIEVKSRMESSLQKVAFQIGDTQIHAYVTTFGSNPLTVLHLHEDEQTALQAARTVLEKHGGRLIQLVHSGQRRVTFTLDGATYSFDPNRIFSEEGVSKTLRGGAPIPAKAYLAVNEFAANLNRYFGLQHQKHLIAVHNNGEGLFSIHSYSPDGEYQFDSEKVFIDQNSDPDDFYYVTDAKIFSVLEQKKLNVILQVSRIVRDDGSLSVFAGRLGIPYINVEAQNEHLEENIRMLEVAVQILSADEREENSSL